MPTPASISLTVERRGQAVYEAGNPFEVKLTVTAVSGDIPDANVFLFQRGVSGVPSEGLSYYMGVATLHQMSKFPSVEPDELQAQSTPFWRSDSTGFLSFDTRDERERFVAIAIESLEAMEASAEELSDTAEIESYVITGGTAELQE